MNATHADINRRDWLKAGGGLRRQLHVRRRCRHSAAAQCRQPPPATTAGRSIRTRSTASSRSTPTARSRSTRARSTSAPACASRSRRWPPRSSACDTARITVVDGDTARCPNTGGTGGSTGLTRGGTAVRQAAATARQALLGLAATRLKRPVADLTIVDWRSAPGCRRSRRIGIGALVGDRRFALPGRPKAPLVPPSQLRDRRHSRRRGPTCRPSAPAAISTSRTSACPACCTAASSVRRRSARRWSRSTRPPSRSFPASASFESRASWRSSRTTSGRRCGRRANSRRRGPTWRGLPGTTTSSAICARAPSTATRRL